MNHTVTHLSFALTPEQMKGIETTKGKKFLQWLLALARIHLRNERTYTYQQPAALLRERRVRGGVNWRMRVTARLMEVNNDKMYYTIVKAVIRPAIVQQCKECESNLTISAPS